MNRRVILKGLVVSAAVAASIYICKKLLESSEENETEVPSSEIPKAEKLAVEEQPSTLTENECSEVRPSIESSQKDKTGEPPSEIPRQKLLVEDQPSKLTETECSEVRTTLESSRKDKTGEPSSENQSTEGILVEEQPSNLTENECPEVKPTLESSQTDKTVEPPSEIPREKLLMEEQASRFMENECSEVRPNLESSQTDKTVEPPSEIPREKLLMKEQASRFMENECSEVRPTLESSQTDKTVEPPSEIPREKLLMEEKASRFMENECSEVRPTLESSQTDKTVEPPSEIPREKLLMEEQASRFMENECSEVRPTLESSQTDKTVEPPSEIPRERLLMEEQASRFMENECSEVRPTMELSQTDKTVEPPSEIPREKLLMEEQASRFMENECSEVRPTMELSQTDKIGEPPSEIRSAEKLLVEEQTLEIARDKLPVEEQPSNLTEMELSEKDKEIPRAEKLLAEEKPPKLTITGMIPTLPPTNSISKNEETITVTAKLESTEQPNRREIIVRTKRNQFTESDRYDQTNQVSASQATAKVPLKKPEYNVCKAVAKPFEYQRQFAESNNSSFTQPGPSRTWTRSACSRFGPLKEIRTTSTGIGTFSAAPRSTSKHVRCSLRAINAGSFDGGDQGRLITYFYSWRDQRPSYRLSFIYNCPAISNYTYASAYKKFGKDVKIVHFLGDNKPWNHTNDSAVAKPFEYQRQFAESKNSSFTQPGPSRTWTRSACSRFGPLKEIRTTSTGIGTSSAAPRSTSKPSNNLASNSCNSVMKSKADEKRKQEAWVTLATNDSYGMGALIVGASLKKSQTTKEIHCMITAEVGDEMGCSLYSVFDHVSMVDELNSNDSENLTLQGRPELGITLTKLNCWKLTQYTKCVFLDADTLVLSNCDELFLHEEFAAVANTGWPDIFNSGVFVFTPSRETYRGLIECAVTIGSFDGGDQGLLNTYFHDWRDKDPSYRLSFIYNCPAISIYTYASAYKKFGKDVKIVHFLGADKPWLHTYAQTSEKVEYGAGSQPLDYHIQQWWRVFSERVQDKVERQQLNIMMDDSKPLPSYNYPQTQPPNVKMDEEANSWPTPVTSMDDLLHRRQWEAGNVDYMGKDSFAKIQKRLDDQITKP